MFNMILETKYELCPRGSIFQVCGSSGHFGEPVFQIFEITVSFFKRTSAEWCIVAAETGQCSLCLRLYNTRLTVTLNCSCEFSKLSSLLWRFYLRFLWISYFLTFCGPCIVIYLRNKSQQDALFYLNLFQQFYLSIILS